MTFDISLTNLGI